MVGVRLGDNQTHSSSGPARRQQQRGALAEHQLWGAIGHGTLWAWDPGLTVRDWDGWRPIHGGFKLREFTGSRARPAPASPQRAAARRYRCRWWPLRPGPAPAPAMASSIPAVSRWPWPGSTPPTSHRARRPAAELMGPAA
eukprot:scaffold2119_cov67-Phaeocystis_antarctica.AAC.3